MYITKGYGFTVDDIDMSCPSDMDAYAKAKIYEENQSDIRNWQMGAYMCHAISLIGKGKYPKEPMFQLKEEEGDSGSNGKEEIAVFEMKQRAKLLEQQGLPLSPL